MKKRNNGHRSLAVLFAALILSLLATTNGQAMINGISGTTFNFTTKDGYITTPDGGSVYMWGFANGDGLMQYPGPTLILEEGQSVTINLTNTLSMPVSIVFPGHEPVMASGGSPGLLTQEADAGGGMVSYTFTADQPGTYLYQSGTRPDLQVEMGLVGAIIVRPASGPGTAYGHPDTAFDHEYLFLLTEMDPTIHEKVLFGRMDQIDNTSYWPVWWFINGRVAPDTMLPPGTPTLPHQPYNCMPRLRPGDKMLMRVIGAGRDMHPFHHHGNNSTIIAKNGRMMTSDSVLGPNLGKSVFTIQSVPGETVDAIFGWTGKDLGWDIYNHSGGEVHTSGPGAGLTICGDYVPGDETTYYDPYTSEYCPDHGKPFPVVLPENQDLAFGGHYSGSPFLGDLGDLPPGEGGLNKYGGYFYMWHSHTEKEMVNNDIFPGGMMTMMIVEPPGTPIP